MPRNAGKIEKDLGLPDGSFVTPYWQAYAFHYLNKGNIEMLAMKWLGEGRPTNAEKYWPGGSSMGKLRWPMDRARIEADVKELFVKKWQNWKGNQYGNSKASAPSPAPNLPLARSAPTKKASAAPARVTAPNDVVELVSEGNEVEDFDGNQHREKRRRTMDPETVKHQDKMRSLEVDNKDLKKKVESLKADHAMEVDNFQFENGKLKNEVEAQKVEIEALKGKIKQLEEQDQGHQLGFPSALKILKPRAGFFDYDEGGDGKRSGA